MEHVRTGAPQVSIPSSQERAWALLCHVSAYLGFFFPFGNVLGPLLVWMFKRDQMPLVREHGREALNFQISVSVYAVILFLVWLVLGFLGMFLLRPGQVPQETPAPGQWAPPIALIIVPMALFGLFVLADIVLVVTGALRGFQGLPWRYPLTFRLVK
jgi:uncharacterized Tic20 family protein